MHREQRREKREIGQRREDIFRPMTRAAAAAAGLLLLVGCVGAGRTEPAGPVVSLEPESTALLGSSAASIGADGETLLVLESSGTRIVRYTSSLAVVDTIPLTERVTAPAGIASDRFYIYVYDNHTLYRMSRERLNLLSWLGDVRVAGLASFDVGVMLVSDADRNAIWYKGAFGESRLFIGSAEVARPGAMVALEARSFAVVSAAARLLYFFNRSGVVTRSVSLPAGCDLLAASGQGTLWMGVRGRPLVWALRAGKMTAYSLPDATSPLAIAVVGGRLAVLDAGTRLSVYTIGD
jgi:hypothetical protein